MLAATIGGRSMMACAAGAAVQSRAAGAAPRGAGAAAAFAAAARRRRVHTPPRRFAAAVAARAGAVDPDAPSPSAPRTEQEVSALAHDSEARQRAMQSPTVPASVRPPRRPLALLPSNPPRPLTILQQTLSLLQ